MPNPTTSTAVPWGHQQQPPSLLVTKSWVFCQKNCVNSVFDFVVCRTSEDKSLHGDCFARQTREPSARTSTTVGAHGTSSQTKCQCFASSRTSNRALNSAPMQDETETANRVGFYASFFWKAVAIGRIFSEDDCAAILPHDIACGRIAVLWGTTKWGLDVSTKIRRQTSEQGEYRRLISERTFRPLCYC